MHEKSVTIVYFRFRPRTPRFFRVCAFSPPSARWGEFKHRFWHSEFEGCNQNPGPHLRGGVVDGDNVWFVGVRCSADGDWVGREVENDIEGILTLPAAKP